MTYSDRDIIDICQAVLDKGLEAPQEFFFASVADLKKICNGVGGAGSWLTWAITLTYRHYQASAAVHDVCYSYATMPRLDADRMFRRNMIREWELRYGWKRWFVAAKERGKIELAYFTVRKLGEKYYGSNQTSPGNSL